MMSIALRFIPTLMNELDKIILAQKSRGSEISSGGAIAKSSALWKAEINNGISKGINALILLISPPELINE
jgi:hypothetical protein